MAYVDYEYYQYTYGGTLTETAFNSVRAQAEAQVDYFTMNKIVNATDAVKNATCACIDILNRRIESNSVVSSESVGNHSRTYAVSVKTDADYKREMYDVCMLFLKNSGLMYRGLKCTLTP